MNNYPKYAADPPQIPSVTFEHAKYLMLHGGQFVDPPKGYLQDQNVLSRCVLDETGNYTLTVLPTDEAYARSAIMRGLGRRLSTATDGAITVPRQLRIVSEESHPFAVLVTERCDGMSLKEAHGGNEAAIRKDFDSILEKVSGVIGRVPTRYLVNNLGEGKLLGTPVYQKIVGPDNERQIILVDPTKFTRPVKRHLHYLGQITGQRKHRTILR